jgi:hypothetical protein
MRERQGFTKTPAPFSTTTKAARRIIAGFFQFLFSINITPKITETRSTLIGPAYRALRARNSSNSTMTQHRKGSQANRKRPADVCEHRLHDWRPPVCPKGRWVLTFAARPRRVRDLYLELLGQL